MEVKMGKNKKFVGLSEEVVKEEANKIVADELAQKAEEPVVEEVEAIVDGVDMSLNVRKEPKVEPNNQVGILGKGTKVIVMKPNEPVKSNGEFWHKIKFGDKEDKQVGYAMKKYIRIL